MRLLHLSVILLLGLVNGTGPASAAETAERVTWDQLAKKISGYDCGEFKHCTGGLNHVNVKVTTRNQTVYRGRALMFRSETMTVSRGSQHWTVNKADLASVEVRPVAHHFHHVTDGIKAPFKATREFCRPNERYSTCPLITGALVAPATWTFSAVVAPFAVATDGVLLLEPTLRFELIP